MNTFFLTCGVLGGVILLAQLVLGALGADHHDASHDSLPADGLQMLSARALSAAVAFFGVGGLAASTAGWPLWLATGAGIVLGSGAMLAVALMMRSMLKLEHDGSISIQRAVGESATVYVPVPASLEGTGKVTLTLQGRTVEYQAVTAENRHLPTGTAVIIVEVRNDDTVEVMLLPSLDGVL